MNECAGVELQGEGVNKLQEKGKEGGGGKTVSATWGWGGVGV